MKIRLNLMDKAATVAAIEQAFEKGVPTGFIQAPERDPQTGLAREIYIEVDDNPDNPVNAIRKAREEAEAAQARAEEQIAKAREAAQSILRMAGPDKAAIQAAYDAVLTIAPEEPNATEGAAAIAGEPVVQNMSAVFIADNAVYREVKREDRE